MATDFEREMSQLGRETSELVGDLVDMVRILAEREQATRAGFHALIVLLIGKGLTTDVETASAVAAFARDAYTQEETAGILQATLQLASDIRVGSHSAVTPFAKT